MVNVLYIYLLERILSVLFNKYWLTCKCSRSQCVQKCLNGNVSLLSLLFSSIPGEVNWGSVRHASGLRNSKAAAQNLPGPTIPDQTTLPPPEDPQHWSGQVSLIYSDHRNQSYDWFEIFLLFWFCLQTHELFTAGGPVQLCGDSLLGRVLPAWGARKNPSRRKHHLLLPKHISWDSAWGQLLVRPDPLFSLSIFM